VLVPKHPGIDPYLLDPCASHATAYQELSI